MRLQYALHVDGKTLTLYEPDELELALAHAQVCRQRTAGPVLVLQLDEGADPMIVERLPDRGKESEHG